MALTSIENHTKAKMRRGFVTQKAEDRGPSKQSLIQENIMLQKMAGVWKAPPAGLIHTALSGPDRDKSGR